jgi:para-aminobenzoate synthetase/4-amino-4-deoxychorismate lyase
VREPGGQLAPIQLAHAGPEPRQVPLDRDRPPAGLAAQCGERASGGEPARLRVLARPGHAGIEIELQLAALGPRQQPVALHVRTLPGGLGAHKWIDRRLLDALSSDGEALLCDLDGLVLESSRANVFVVDGQGRLLTPPTDGRILPGVTRARVLVQAVALGLQVQVQPLAMRELRGARELIVTGSLGGVESAQLDGAPSAPGPVGTQLAQALIKGSLLAA